MMEQWGWVSLDADWKEPKSKGGMSPYGFN